MIYNTREHVVASRQRGDCHREPYLSHLYAGLTVNHKGDQRSELGETCSYQRTAFLQATVEMVDEVSTSSGIWQKLDDSGPRDIDMRRVAIGMYSYPHYLAVEVLLQNSPRYIWGKVRGDSTPYIFPYIFPYRKHHIRCLSNN